MESSKKVRKNVKDTKPVEVEPPVVEQTNQKEDVLEVSGKDNKVLKVPKKSSLSSMYQKLNKTLKKGKIELTEQEINQLNILFKEEFPTCRFVVPHHLYGQLKESSKKQTVILEDSRFKDGFIVIKKSNPTLKQIINQMTTIYTPEMLKDGDKIVSLNYNNVNTKVDTLTITWSK